MKTPVRLLPPLVSIMLCATLAAAAARAARAPKSGSGSAKQSPPAELARQKVTPEIQERVHQMLVRGPLHFEANAGQFDRSVRFLSRGPDHTLFLTATGAVLVLPGGRRGSYGLPSRKGRLEQGEGQAGAVARLNLVGSNPAPQVLGLDELPGKANYFLGKDPSQWRTDVPLYARVRYEKIYPGVDLVYYGNEGQLEYDFVVAPGADSSPIAFEIAGLPNPQGKSANRAGSILRIDKNGDLTFEMSGKGVRFHRPVAYQVVNGDKRFIPAEYARRGDCQMGFKLAAYDVTKPLIIDPSLSFSTYLGGTRLDQGYGISVDDSGNIYVAGLSNSDGFPTTASSYQPDLNAGTCGSTTCPDVFVTKLNDTGTSLVYSTYIGGLGADGANGIAVDSAGNAYVTGFTDSDDFPTTPATAYQPSYNGGTCVQGGVSVRCNDAFMAKLNPAGDSLLYSTYMGSSGEEKGTAIAVDSSGDAYVAGYVSSTAFPTTAGVVQAASGGGNCAVAPSSALCSDAFVAKLDPTLSGAASLLYSTYLGGNGDDYANGIALDSSDNAYIVGYSQPNPNDVNNFPTTAGAAQGTAPGGLDDAFLTKLNAAATARSYSTYIGGNGQDEALGVAVEHDTGSGKDFAYVAGFTNSSNLPVSTGAYQSALGGGTCGTAPNTYACVDAFVMKFDPSLAGASSRVFSTYLGGNSDDVATAIAVDDSGNPYVTGGATSTNFPLLNAFQASIGGDYDVFVTKLNATATALGYSTFLGGSQFDAGYGIALDSGDDAYLIGYTASANFPSTAGTIQTSSGGGGYDAFVAKISPTSPSFDLSVASNSKTVNAGASATYDLTVTPQNGFNQAVSFTCTGAPQAATCSVSPSPVTPSDGTTPVSATATVTTTARSAAPPGLGSPWTLPAPSGWHGLPWLLALMLLLLTAGIAALEKRRAWLVLTMMLLLMTTWAACGGGGGGGTTPPPQTGTPAGTYTLTVTATSGTISHSIALTLKVN